MALAQRVVVALASGDVRRAAAAVLEALGAELFGFLVTILGDVRVARSSYGAIGESLVRELPQFRWRCTLRVWTYALARRELAHARGPNHARTSASPSTPPRGIRPAPYRGIPLASVAPTILQGLSSDDRQLLVLRFGRGLTWRELAVTSLGEAASERRLLSEAEALRRRLGRIRDRVVRTTGRHGAGSC